MKTIIFAVSIAACLMGSATVLNAQSSGEEITRPAVIKGNVSVLPCERNLPEGKACVHIYYQPEARIEVFKMMSDDTYPLAYERVSEVIVPNITAPLGRQDVFELLLAPGTYMFSIHNEHNGQQSTLGPVDIKAIVAEARFAITMYNHREGRSGFYPLVPREICMEYVPQRNYDSDIVELRLIPTLVCSSVEPGAIVRNLK